MLGEKTYPGVTPPLSLAASSENDKKLENALEMTLNQFNLFESKEMTLLRQVITCTFFRSLTKHSQTVLEKLDEMTKTFVYNVSLKRGLSPAAARKAGGKILTFGSYRLGVHAAGADIDTLCVFPRHVTRDDFFEEMYVMLQKQRGVTDLTAVTTSFVPVVKFKFFGIPIDLLCARLVLPTIPEDLGVNDPALLQNLDERCIRSLNGSRVAAEILELVPEVNVFRTALRWGWPNPVILKNIEEGSVRTTLKPWNPKLNVMDRGHIMPIITPAYPSMCATHNVTSSTLKIVLGEFRKAARVVNKIMVGAAPWSLLFEEQGGWVESRLRRLLLMLESVDVVALVHPFVDSFDTERFCLNDAEVQDVVHGKAMRSEYNASNRKSEGQDGRTIHTRTFYIGLFIKFDPAGKEQGDNESGQRKKNSIDLAHPINRFKESVEQWQEYDERHVGIFIQHLKRSMLPPEVTSKTMSAKRQSEAAASELERTTAIKKPRTQATSLGEAGEARSEDFSSRIAPPAIPDVQRVSQPASEQQLPSFSLSSC
ncbi:polynucleotide adenylyltransferase [Apophysomyces sp. BC1015]|nr:polynucleotide adenylyltransferase [Apophysomyces sp. BC1015]